MTILSNNNKAFDKRGFLFGYEYPALQKVNQAAGRPIRREEDKAAIIHMDSRFKCKYLLISDWVRDEIELVPDKLGDLSHHLKIFWQ